MLVGTKRPSLEQDYYEMVDRPNVKLVNLRQWHQTQQLAISSNSPA
jgi:hypothetical protein